MNYYDQPHAMPMPTFPPYMGPPQSAQHQYMVPQLFYPAWQPAPQVEAQKVRTIYLKGLPLNTSQRELDNIVSTQRGFEDYTVETRGVSFQVWARYQTPEHALSAIEALNGHLFDRKHGIYLEAQLARSDFRAPRSVLGYSEEGGPLNNGLAYPENVLNRGDNPRCSTLYIGNLCPGAKHDELQELFAGSPGFLDVHACVKGDKTSYFVEFVDEYCAEAVHNNCQGVTILSNRGRPIRIQYAKARYGNRFWVQPTTSNAPSSVNVEAPESGPSSAEPEGGETSETALPSVVPKGRETPDTPVVSAVPEGGENPNGALSPAVLVETPKPCPIPASPESLPSLTVGGEVPIGSKDPTTPDSKTPTSTLAREFPESRSGSDGTEGEPLSAELQTSTTDMPQVSKEGTANTSSEQGAESVVDSKMATAVLAPIACNLVRQSPKSRKRYPPKSQK